MKKKVYVSILLCLVLVVCSFTFPVSGDRSSIEYDMKTLASKEFMGRLVGTAGNEKAVSYIAGRFSQIGLERFDEDYYHVCKQTVYKPEKQIHYLEAVFEDGTSEQYIYGKDFVDWYPVREADISAPITFDKEDPNISDKIIVLEKGESTKNYINKCKAIFRKTDSFFRVAIVRAKGTPYIEISEELYDTLLTEKIKAVKLITRYVPEEIDVKQAMGKISGTDHKKLMVLSAHMDHVGWAGKTIFYGASDNASGTSVIIDIAAKLKKQSEKKPFDMDILICAFNGEDSMLKNGDMLLSELKSKYDYIYDINLDTLGKKDGGKITLNGDEGLNKDLMKDLTDCFSKNKYGVLNEYYGESDHVIFNRQGFCGITIGQIDVMGENGTTNIHTSKDSLKMIDYSQLCMVSNIVYDFIVTNDGKVYKPAGK